jgi:chromate transporter
MSVGAVLDTSTVWWPMFLHFAALSVLAVGGAITTAPDMHR